ncbi:MAG: hypothetical protein J5804_02085 [Eggerthellaceae bacterium]|nr:hypothetical protein [Eggerthellaceae bacterium]
MTNQELFRKTALQHASSPGQLDGYIRATQPGTWLVVLAALVAIVALLVWGVFGRVATTIDDNGIISDGQVVCYLNEQDYSEVKVGDSATVNDQPAKVSNVVPTPVSKREAASGIDDDYTVSMLELEEWNYEIDLSMDDLPDDGTLVPIVITTQEVAPISFVLNGKDAQ